MKIPKFKPIQSVQRAIDILDCFESVRPALTLAEISEKTGLNINTTRGIVNTLMANNLLIRDPETMTYSLGMYFLGKSEMIRNNIDGYVTLFKPIVDGIAERYHFASSLQLVNMNQVFSIYCAYPTNRGYYIVLSEFTSLPKHATSSGKLLLLDEYRRKGEAALTDIQFKIFTENSLKSKEELIRELRRVERNGYATEEEEYANDVGSVAVPIYDSDGRLALTISATAFEKDLTKAMAALTKDLKKAVLYWQASQQKG
jgi:IclR family KDG regulon transcriptional repressor